MTASTNALINLRPLFGEMPAEFGESGIHADFGQLIVAAIFDVMPDLIVECGSGNSSVLVAACIKELRCGTLVTLDSELDTGALPGKIDLLIVDGPRETAGRLAWLPAIEVLKPMLSERCVILIDDGERDEGREIVRKWSEELGADSQYVPTLRGAWRLTPGREKRHALHVAAARLRRVLPGNASSLPFSETRRLAREARGRFERKNKNRAANIVHWIRESFPLSRKALSLTSANTNALINVRPLFGALPAEFGGWAIEADFGQVIVSAILDSKPDLIVECGSGNSSVLIAALIEKLGHGMLVSLEHDEEFAARTRRMLEAHGLQSFAEIRHTPLVPLQGKGALWYDLDIGTIPGKIDLLIVDGPPAPTGRLARLPAIPVLKPMLSDRCVILLDDGDRGDERETAKRWSEELSARRQYLPVLRGAWMLTPK